MIWMKIFNRMLIFRMPYFQSCIKFIHEARFVLICNSNLLLKEDVANYYCMILVTGLLQLSKECLFFCVNLYLDLLLLGPAKVNKSQNFFRILLYHQTCTNVRFRCSGVCFGRFYKSKLVKIVFKNFLTNTN